MCTVCAVSTSGVMATPGPPRRFGVGGLTAPIRRGGPGLAITPLVDAAQTLHTTGLVAVVVLALVGWLVAERRA